MIAKTNNTLILLKFEDSDNPAKDECNNIKWTFDNNHYDIVYDEKIKKKCLYFNTNYHCGVNPNTYVVLGDTDFTIDGMFCSYSNLNDTTYEMLWTYTLNTTTSNYRSLDFYQSKLTLNFYDHNNFTFDISNTIKSGEWFHIAFTYNYKANKYSTYINGSLVNIQNSQNTERYKKNIYIYIAKVYNLANSFRNGKIAYFRVEKDLLFTENFDWMSLLSNNISINNNYDTQRSIKNNYKQINYKAFEFM